MNLHYSQTKPSVFILLSLFYYLMNLHYSQTTAKSLQARLSVLLPYEFTLLSNLLSARIVRFSVLLPYEFTLLSNNCVFIPALIRFYYLMNLHYSQTYLLLLLLFLWFYYLMNLHYSQTIDDFLKTRQGVLLPYEFTLLSNKRKKARQGAKFYYLMNLHYSQTKFQSIVRMVQFYYLMNLHYSQTVKSLKFI